MARQKKMWYAVNGYQRRAARAAGLRAKGQFVKRELVPDPHPDDLIKMSDIPAIVGLTQHGIEEIRKRGRAKHPMPEPYLKRPWGGKGYKYCWRRQDIEDWAEERRCWKMSVFLTSYEIYQLRKWLRDLPDYGERVAKDIRQLLAIPLELESEAQTDDGTADTDDPSGDGSRPG